MSTRRSSAVPCLLACLLLLASACSRGEEEVERRLEAAMGSLRGGELLEALIALDQEYPRHLPLKINIGALLIASGRLDTAGAYLEQGERLLGRRDPPRLAYLLHGNLAELCYRRGDHPRGVEQARLALAAGVPDELGVTFTLGKCLAASGKPQEALPAFDAGWERRRQSMGSEDLRQYAELLFDSGRGEDALAVAAEHQSRFGFSLALGLRRAAFFERQGKGQDAVLASFECLEYLRQGGGLSAAAELERLWELERALADGGKAGLLVAALDSYLRGHYEEALGRLQGLRLEGDPELFRYLRLSAALESRPVTERTLSAYLKLEPRFRYLPAYYYHLWRGMRTGPPELYTLEAVRPILERCILLAPQAESAGASRVELGRLLGLADAEAEALLLPAEMDRLYRQAAQGGSSELLEPLLRMLSAGDTPYHAAALLVLKEARRTPSLEEYLRRRLRGARGLLRERLEAVLGP